MPKRRTTRRKTRGRQRGGILPLLMATGAFKRKRGRFTPVSLTSLTGRLRSRGQKGRGFGAMSVGAAGLMARRMLKRRRR